MIFKSMFVSNGYISRNNKCFINNYIHSILEIILTIEAYFTISHLQAFKKSLCALILGEIYSNT